MTCPTPPGATVECHHRHGTVRRYSPRRCHTKCSCTKCRIAWNAYHRQRRAERRAGITTLVDATPVIAHIQNLSAAKLGATQLARLSGVAPTHIRAIATGRHPQIAWYTADAILSITADRNVFVDSLAAVRMIQALAVAGYQLYYLDTLAGYGRSMMSNTAARGGLIRRETADTVACLYDKLRDQHDDPNRCRLAGLRAGKKGWAPIEAWTDDTIADPDARPYSWDALAAAIPADVDPVKVWRMCNAERFEHTTRAERVAAVALLAARRNHDGQPNSDAEIADILGTSDRTVLRYRSENGVAAGRPECAPPRPPRVDRATYLARLVRRYRQLARNRDQLVAADARTALADVLAACEAAGVEPPAERVKARRPRGVAALDLADYDQQRGAA